MTRLCPKSACGAKEFDTGAALAAHLIDAHLMNGLTALTLARQTTPTPLPAKEILMAANDKKHATCHACGVAGHTRRSAECPERGNPAPRAAMKWKPITRRHPLPTRKAGGAKGARPVDRAAEVAAVLAVYEELEAFAPDAQRRLIRCVCVLLSLDPAALAV